MCWNIIENAKRRCDSFVSLFTLTFAGKYDILFSANKFGGIDLYFFSREVNFDDSYDVIVAGGGPAGGLPRRARQPARERKLCLSRRPARSAA